jgi:hypothetical protein
MVHLIFGIPWLVVVVRFIQPLPWIWSIKASVAILLLVASQFHLISRLSSGSVFDPEFPRPLVIAFNVLFGWIVLLAVFQIALDVVSLAIIPLNGGFPSAPAGLRYAIGILVLGLSAYGVRQAIRVPPLKDIEIPVVGLPPEFDGYRMVQLTDLHISRLFPAAWTKEVVSRTNALGADLIVITGDFIDGDVAHRRNDVAPLAGLKAHDGVYAIPGNHEHFFDYQEWMRHLDMLGMRMLSNSRVALKRRNAEIVLAGVTDLSARGHSAPPPDLAAAIKGVPAHTPHLIARSPADDGRESGRRWCGASAVGAYPWWHGSRPRPLDRARQWRLCLGSIPSRSHDIICKQRNGYMAGIRVKARSAIGTDQNHPPRQNEVIGRHPLNGFCAVVEESAGACLTGFRGCESGGKTMPRQPAAFRFPRSVTGRDDLLDVAGHPLAG